MSDAPTTERAALEAKDRDELAQIVVALGGRSTVRTRKETLIDQILDLTGLTSDEGSSGQDAAGTNGHSNDNGDVSADDRSVDAHSNAELTRRRVGPGARMPGRVPTSGGESTPARNTRTSRTTQTESASVSHEAANDRNGQTHNNTPEADKAEKSPSGTANRSGHGTSVDELAQEGLTVSDLTPVDNDEVGSDVDVEDGDEAGNRRRRRRGRNRDNQNGDEFQGDPVEVSGYLDLRDDGYGFLRVNGYLPSREDAYVSVKQVRQFSLRNGDHIVGASRPALRSEKNPALLRIDAVAGINPDQAKSRPLFDDQTPINPNELLWLSGSPTLSDEAALTVKVIDAAAPIGKGSRVLVAGPHRTGKTTTLVHIAQALVSAYEEVAIVVVLVDQRPEEVTEFARMVPGAEVVGSSFDRPAEEHIRVGELALARVERLVEEGRDVVVMLDSVTRLTRAYNATVNGSGRVLAGGLDSAALFPPRRFMSAGRNLEEGGSLTVIATATDGTGSALDELAYAELATAANLVIRLDPQCADARVYPAIDPVASHSVCEPMGAEYLREQGVGLDDCAAFRRRMADLSHGGAGGHAGKAVEILLASLSGSASVPDAVRSIASGS